MMMMDGSSLLKNVKRTRIETLLYSSRVDRELDVFRNALHSSCVHSSSCAFDSFVFCLYSSALRMKKLDARRGVI